MDKNDIVRPPIVTIMGHVDHGKTTLLDTIRKTNVAAHEHGGITQHIGAYQIIFQDKPITFIDTPGHAAFEKMRSRGAEVADIVILVVAANDGVKPQTLEAIKHLKRAKKPTIVAITKTDLPDINVDKVKQQLQTAGIVVENYGGDTPVVEVAATKGKGIDELLEVILLVWQLAPEPSKPQDLLEAIVVESFMDKNRGAVVTVIVKTGTIKVGQKIIVDGQSFAVKALVDDNGKNIKEAIPGKPVEILGFKTSLEVGSVVSDQIATHQKDVKKPLSIGEIIAKSEAAKDKFKVVIKADVNGSLEAVLNNLPEKILVMSASVGEVNGSDVSFAKVTNAPILAFNTKVPSSIKAQAEREGVLIREYKVIYELISDMEDIATSFELAKHELKITGRAKVVATFNIEGKLIAGIKVTHGKLKLQDTIIVRRNDQDAGTESKIVSLKKFKKDVDVITGGQDGGLIAEPKIDFSEGDSIESIGL